MKSLLRGVIVVGIGFAPLVMASSCASSGGTGSETHFVCESDEACIAASRGNVCVHHVCRTLTGVPDSGLDASPGSGGRGGSSGSGETDSSVGAGGGGANGGAGGASSGGSRGDAQPDGQGGTDVDADAAPSCGNKMNDNNNCGACGHVCPGTTNCVQGSCACFGCGMPTAIAIDATSVYFTTAEKLPGRAGTVMKEPLAGGGATTLTSDQYGYGIASDSTSVYFFSAAGSAGRLMKMPLSGGVPTQLLQGPRNPWAIALDATSVYWVNGPSDSPPDGTLMKIPLAGGTPTTLISGLTAVGSVAVDGTNVYVIDGAQATDSDGGFVDGRVMKIPLAGGTPVSSLWRQPRRVSPSTAPASTGRAATA